MIALEDLFMHCACLVEEGAVKRPCGLEALYLDLPNRRVLCAMHAVEAENQREAGDDEQ